MALKQIPLISKYSERTPEGGQDTHMTNVYLEERNGKPVIRSRPGLTHLTSPGSYVAHGMFYLDNAVIPETLYLLDDGTNWDLYRLDGLNTPSKLYDVPTATVSGADTVVNWARCGTDGSGYDIVAFAFASSGFIYKARTGVTEITDADFNGGYRGIVYLDGYLFACDGSTIQNSSNGDHTAWAATDYITPQTMANPVGIKWIALHKNHIVAFGKHSIEFLYNAGNASGSPLSPRRDIIYTNIGVYNGNFATNQTTAPSLCIAEIDRGERIAFVSQNLEGKIGVHLLDNFQIKKLSTNDIDKYFVQKGITADRYPVLTSFTMDNRSFLCLTIKWYDGAENAYSFIYDFESGIWHPWTANAAICASGEFQMTGSAANVYSDITTSPEWPIGAAIQMNDGEIYLLDRIAYQDTDALAATHSIAVEIVTDKYMGEDGTEGIRKFMDELKLFGDRPGTSQQVTIEYTDDDYATYTSAGHSIDVNDPESKMTGLGSFYERAFKLTYSANALIRLYPFMNARIRTGNR